jgi:hypothetical protein
MKKAIAILLVLLVAGVVFGATTYYGDLNTSNELTLNATNASKTTFTVDQLEGEEEDKISLDVGSTFRGSAGVEVATWSFFSTTGDATPSVEITFDGVFTSEANDDYTIPYEVAFENAASTTSTFSASTITYEDFARTGNNGAFLTTSNENNGSVYVKIATGQESTEYAAAEDYTTKIKFSVTAL